MDRIEKLRQFLEADPADSFLQHALAMEYIKTGDDETAFYLLKELLTKDPAYVGSYYHIGKVLERMGETAAAVKWYEKGMEEARKAGENHAHSELKGAWEELTFF